MSRGIKFVKINYLFFIFFLFLIIFSSCQKQRTPISYELPKKYVGWVTIKYEKPGAPPLEKIGDNYLMKIPPNGIFETSSKLENGAAEDEYFWQDSGKKVTVQQYDENNTSMIHGDHYTSLGFQEFVKLDTLPLDEQVTLPDGGTVTRTDDKGGVKFKSGRYLMYHFYVSAAPEDLVLFQKEIPPLPPEQEKW
jgi:hypothetical protein